MTGSLGLLWLNVQYRFIWYPNENLLDLYKSYFQSNQVLGPGFPWVLVNMIYSTEADQYDTKWKYTAH